MRVEQSCQARHRTVRWTCLYDRTSCRTVLLPCLLLSVWLHVLLTSICRWAGEPPGLACTSLSVSAHKPACKHIPVVRC